MDIVRVVTRLVEPLKRKVYLMVGRCVLSAIDDASKIQAIKATLLAGEVRDQIERFQEYGFTSVPFPGAEAVAVFVGGSREHGLVIATDDRRYRLKNLTKGEVAIYDDQGQRVYLKRNGIRVESPNNIEIETDGVLRLEGDGIEIHGRTYVQQDVAGKGSRETHNGGNWHTDSYTTGAATSGAEHGLDTPHIPSDHPDGP